jgi:PEP-CTERM motif
LKISSAVANLAVLGLLVAAPVAAHAQTINTFAAWDGTSNAFPFGAGNTATYGETITAPGGLLNNFSFWFNNNTNGGALQYSAFVGTWTGSAVGTVLWQSGGTFTGNGSSTFVQQQFNTGGLALTTGQIYALFVNASAFIGANPSTTAQDNLGATPTSTYAGGAYIYTNNGSNFNGIFSAWDQPGGTTAFCGTCDLAMVANFSAGAVSVTPEPATMSLMATGLVGLVAARRRRKRA